MSEPAPFSQFEGEKVISLETYRKNGQPVRTPVWFLKEDGILYVHTDDITGKVKRIRQNPTVRVAPSHFRGKPKAEYVEAQAVLNQVQEPSRSIIRRSTRSTASKEHSPGSFNVSQEAKPTTSLSSFTCKTDRPSFSFGLLWKFH